MARLQQGSVVWADLASPLGRRPAVVLTRDAAIGRLNGITIAPITRTIRGGKTEVILEPVDGVSTTSAVLLDNILTVERVDLHEVITVLGVSKMREILEAVKIAFDIT